MNTNPYLDHSVYAYEPSERELNKASCTHKYKDGSNALVVKPDGPVTCDICHKTFTMTEFDEKKVAEIVEDLTNACETIKTIRIDNVSADFIDYVSHLICYLSRFGEIYEETMDIFNSFNPAIPSPSDNALKNLLGMSKAMPNLPKGAFYPYPGYRPDK